MIHRWLLFIVSLLIILSCNRSDQSLLSHPEHFDKIYEQADEMCKVDPVHVFKFLDSSYSSFHNPGGIDLYRKYAYKLNFQQNITIFDRYSIGYVDSMFAALGPHIHEKEFARYYADALLKKAYVMAWRQNFQQSLVSAYQARQLIEQTNDSCLLSSYTFMVAAVSYRQKKYPDAIKYDLLALSENASCPDNYAKYKQTQGRLNEIALAYLHYNMPDSALFYFDSAIRFINKHDLPRDENEPDMNFFSKEATGVIYGNMGDAWLEKGDTVNAEKYYKLDINNEYGYDRGDGVSNKLKIVNLYVLEGKLALANELMGSLRSSLDSFPDEDNNAKWYRERLELIDKTGENGIISRYIDTYLKLKDSAEHRKAVPPIDMESEYERIKGQSALSLMAKENELRNRYFIIAIICLLLIVAIASLLWYSWRVSRSQNNNIRRKNIEIRRQNNELQFMLNSLTESQKENMQMMQIVAHDLRNPISSMISVTSLILDNNDLKSDDRELLELMRESSYGAINLISDLLFINSTKEQLTKENVEISALLHSCCSLLQFKASEKGQRIILHAENVQLLINRDKMWRVFSNLITNAIKFSGEGKEIHIEGKTDDGNYLIAIKDTGIGIPDELQGRIFEMFTDARRNGTNGEESFGLGLSISKQIVEAHNGRIWLQSTPGEATTFFVSLPLTGN